MAWRFRYTRCRNPWYENFSMCFRISTIWTRKTTRRITVIYWQSPQTNELEKIWLLLGIILKLKRIGCWMWYVLLYLLVYRILCACWATPPTNFFLIFCALSIFSLFHSVETFAKRYAAGDIGPTLLIRVLVCRCWPRIATRSTRR